MLISKFRDLVLMEFSEGKILTIANDSCSGICSNEKDLVKSDGEIIGYLTTRVCMIETLCYRALPKVIVNNLCVEMNGEGDRILNGIHRAMNEFNSLNFERKLDDDNLTGSTDDDNIEHIQTAFGVTVIGEEIADERLWEINKGDLLVAIGNPLSGDEIISIVNSDSYEFISMKSLKVVLDYSKDVVAVGDKGINHHVNVLEETNGIEIKKVEDLNIDCEKKCYGNSMVLAIVEEDMLGKIERRIDEDITVIGKVKILK